MPFWLAGRRKVRMKIISLEQAVSVMERSNCVLVIQSLSIM